MLVFFYAREPIAFARRRTGMLVRSLVRLALLAAVLTACGPLLRTPQPQADAVAPRDLASARARWRDAGPSDYSFTYRLDCRCVGSGETTVEVRGGTANVVARSHSSDAPALRVENVFDRIGDAERASATVRVVFDRQLGYPAEFGWNEHLKPVDGGSTLTIVALHAIK